MVLPPVRNPSLYGLSPALVARTSSTLPDIAFDGQTTLGYAPNGYPAEGTSSLSDGIHVANIALLGSYMASSFAIASDGHGGTSIMAESTIQSPQLLLGTPHH